MHIAARLTPVSVLLQFSFLLFWLAACAPAKKVFPANEPQALIAFSQALGRCPSGSVQGAQENYLRNLSGRFAPLADRYNSPPLKFLLGKCQQVLAMGDSQSTFLVSQPLARSLANESELAFVLMHEWAHVLLGHYSLNFAGLPPDRRQKLELAADERALGLVAFAGYDPGYAMLAVTRFAEQDEAYPPAEERLERLREELKRSGWLPPGRIDSRDFRIFVGSLG